MFRTIAQHMGLRAQQDNRSTRTALCGIRILCGFLVFHWGDAKSLGSFFELSRCNFRKNHGEFDLPKSVGNELVLEKDNLALRPARE